MAIAAVACVCASAAQSGGDAPATPVTTAASAAADSCADLALARVGEARFILARPGAQAEALRRRAKIRGLRLEVLELPGAGAADVPDVSSAKAAAIECGASTGVVAALDLGALPFAAVWLRASGADAARFLRLADMPAALDALSTGFTGVPDGLLFAPVATNDVASRLDAAMRGCGEVREMLGETLLELSSADRDAPEIRQWRRLAALCGNNLGCLLAEAGRVEDAAAAFRSADAVCPDAVSPLLNLASLAKRGTGAAARGDLGGRLNALGASGAAPTSLATSGGYILYPEDFFEAGWFWAASGLRLPDAARAEEMLAAAEARGGEKMRDAVGRLLNADFSLRGGLAQPLIAAYDASGAVSTGGLGARASLGLARLLFDRNERPRALALLDAAERSGLKSPEESLALTLAHLDMLGRACRVDEIVARRSLFRALPDSPQFARLTLALAAASVDAGDLGAAAGDWRELSRRVPAAAPWAAAP